MRSGTLTGLALLAAVAIPADAHAIPAWARKYNMNCSGCHSPNVPRLNAKGYAFKWAGYRMPEEIGEDQQAKQVSDYLAARAQFQYVIVKTEKQPTEASGFNLDNIAVYAGGSIGKNYGAFFQVEQAPDGVNLVAHMVGVWGKENRYVGLRGGQMHWLFEGGVAGFDRPTGISEPTPLGQTTAAAPFAFASDAAGLEAFTVMGKNRFSLEVLNSLDVNGAGGADAQPGTKDFAAIDQWIYDYNGSGITAVAYMGSTKGLDAGTPDQTSHYTRLAVSANKIFKNAELQGGYVYGKDNSLPVGGTFAQSTMTGTGYWAYGWTFPNTVTGFARYEFTNPDKDATDAGSTRLVLGGVLPANIPQNLRLVGEYTLDMPKLSGAPKTSGLVAELMIAF